MLKLCVPFTMKLTRISANLGYIVVWDLNNTTIN